MVDGEAAGPDAAVDASATSRIGPTEICGNGLDDNGDGYIDENCPCYVGQTQGCWPGDPKNRHQGGCKDGVQTCTALNNEFAHWGPCVGAVLPSAGNTCEPAPACVPTTEVCNDGKDNDCDGKVDCDDPDCARAANCQPKCVPTPEVCNDGKDNDCDGKVDCDDPDCAQAANCQPCVPTPEVCNDGKDNDCDGKVDCADPDCAQAANCQPKCVPTPEVCNDGKDNDCDGKVDCDDPDCAHAANCQVCVPDLTWEYCGDGKDNDCNGLTDCDDPQCQDTAFCVCTSETCEPGTTRWCDGPVFCDWGVQTCSADKSWGRCIEANEHPGTCNPQIYDWSCCVNAGGCCQSPFDGSSVGDCPGVVKSCQPS